MGTAAARFAPFRTGGYADVLLDAARGRVWKRAPLTCTASFVECALLASLRHLPRLPSTLHIYKTNQHLNCVQRYEGETLHEWSKRAAAAADGKRILPTLARDVVVALLALRDAGILHTDVKTTNVLVKNGRATLIDFNCVALRQAAPDDDDEQPTWGKAGTAVGTWAYAAPELVTQRDAAEPAVVWAWAVTLACAWGRAHPVTGNEPLPADRAAWVQLLADARAADGDALPLGRAAGALPSGWAELLRACLRWEPSQRPTLDDVFATCQRLHAAAPPHHWPRQAYASFWPPARPDAWPLAVRRDAWVQALADHARGSAWRRAKFLTACYLLDRAAPVVVTDDATAARATIACLHVVECMFGNALLLRPAATLGVSAADALQMLWCIAERLHWALYIPCIDAMLLQSAAPSPPPLFEARVAALAARTRPYTPCSLVGDMTLGV